MKSRVYFTEASLREAPQSIEGKLKVLIKESDIFKAIAKNDFVCVKLTFGEKDNKGYILPRYMRIIVDELRKIGTRPFLCDTNTLYKGSRQNAIDHINLAIEHGFTLEAADAPVIIGDGLSGEGYAEVRVGKKHISVAKIAKIAHDSDGLIALTHFTGHMFTGFGGAIKNIGMGLASRAGKLIQHSSVKPHVVVDNCTGCWKCIAVCPANAIKSDDKKAHISTKLCIGCGDCLVVCRFDAIYISWSESSQNLQEKMAEYALAAIKDKGQKVGFVNFLTHITAECDCLAKDDPDIVADIGILASKDPLAIDKASIDLVLSRSKKDPFKAAHQKIDWRFQLEHANVIGLGSLDYELVKVA